MEDDKEHKCDSGDEIVAGPDLGDGTRPFVRHGADHSITGGLMRKVREGEPCNGRELVSLTKIDEDRYKVQTLYSPQAGGQDECQDCAHEKKGPSSVVTDRYRDGWDRIFGSKVVGQA